ncbi:MAG: membrane protein insertase YidC [Firmicutes bacterium]|nr:membrane protein insertase YidC [Bacillota bacterium]
MNPFKYLIMIPFGWVLRQIYLVVGNYGLTLILFSLLVKIILLPLSIKSKRSMMKMNRLSPMLQALQKKYGDDKQKYNQAVMELYKQEGASPTGGCLWSLLPIAIVIPLYYVIRSPLTYIVGLNAEQVQTVMDVLASKGVEFATSGRESFYQQIIASSHIHTYLDQISAALPEVSSKLLDLNYNFLGVNLSATPQFKFWTNGVTWASVGLFLIPWISGLAQLGSSILSQKLNNSVATNDKGEKDSAAADTVNASAKGMLYMMPLISVYIGFVMPAAIAIYWIAQAVFTALQEVLLTRLLRKEYDEEDAQKKLRVLQQEAEEAEKARKRAEKQASGQYDGTENVSKKKLERMKEQANQQELAAKFGDSDEPKEKAPEDQKGYSGDPERPFSRGRAYKPERYGRKDSGDSANEQ